MELKDKNKGEIPMLYEENEVLTVSELCERLMISETTAYKLLRSGEIKGFQIGNHWRIPVENIKQYIRDKCSK